MLSMLFTAKSSGVKRLAVREDSHKSVFNGCALLGISPVLLPVEKKGGIPLPVTLSDIEQADADAVFITSPDYYGNIPDLQAIGEYCKNTGKMLVIDGAHGGHLHFNKTLYAGEYADLWVDGVHKSLPALTQGAIVCAKTAALSQKLARAVDIFRTTSPSYPIMASVEYAAKYPQNEWLQTQASAWQKGTDRLYLGDDWTKIVALFGKNAEIVHERLRKEGVYAEFCDGNAVTFYLSPATTKRDFLRLKKRLAALFETYLYVPVDDVPAPVVFEKTGEKEWVEMEKSIGRICAEFCGLFPPCTPLICVGEVITEEKIRLLQNADNAFGIKGKEISVFKAEEKE